MGVWIETRWFWNRDAYQTSHPAWVCGLKPSGPHPWTGSKGHTLRGCVDWNLTMTSLWPDFKVTPCVGVWIETRIYSSNWGTSLVTPCVGVWIETLKGVQTGFYRGHTLRGCVDWNIPESIELMISISHTLRGCVDWNTRTGWILYFRMCHTLRGCVDWNFIRMIHNNQQEGHTLRGCVDWNTQSTTIIARMNCHTLRGCIWIEALFTRWSSLWKNCKHSASCVFLFKLL